MADALPYFTDAEVDDMCAGLEQNAAKVRHLRRLGLRVDRKPNGRPLAWKPLAEATTPAQNAQHDAAGVIVGLNAWAAGRRERNGQKTQGR
jgi:hypothetical protein